MRLPSLFSFSLCIFLFIHSTQAQKTLLAPVKPTKTWLTLTGGQPDIIARGGFSGVFPDSSSNAIQLAQETSINELVLLCDLQLTKDSHGICLSSFHLGNITTIGDTFPDAQKSYDFNGRQISGWFPFDYTLDELKSVSLIQNVYSRPSAFDGLMPITVLEDMTSIKHTRVWLNVQHNSLYVQQKLDPISYVSKALATMRINFISSPEIGFLKAIKGKVMGGKTKLIFRFQHKDEVEPTTKQTYGSLLKSLATVKEVASGILVPKDYIWPVGNDMYLQPATTLVNDVHRQGLEIYAYEFANDYPASFNYSYDPAAEYLQFIDNSQFCVDGMVTDFPSTCSDLAYEKAITDGADIIDCSVQMSKDGIAFCLDTADLSGDTTAFNTFMQRSTVIPAFLDIAKTKAVTGVLINIRNAAFLASRRSLNIIDAVNAALSNASLDKQVTQKVMIQSDDTQVLEKFKSNLNYEKVLTIRDKISNVPKETTDEIKKYAHSVAIPRTSILKNTESFTASVSSVVEQLHAANISVYVFVFRNEYISMAFDFFADPMMELATYIGSMGVDGIITEFPRTADAYLRSPCANPDNEAYSIFPVQPGSLLQLTQPGSLPPTAAPAPALTVADIVDPPLPSLTSETPPIAIGPSSGTTLKSASFSYSILSMAFICTIWFN